jgi:hypothetical protein
VRPGKRKITIRPDRLTFSEFRYRTPGRQKPKHTIAVVDKWIYLFELDSGELYAEIYAENDELWHIDYRPRGIKELERFDRKRKGFIVINRKRFENGNYCAFLSPIRAGEDALDLLKDNLAELDVVEPHGINPNGIANFDISDMYFSTEHYHKFISGSFEELSNFVSDSERQAKLFIASVVDSWLADGDPAEVGEYLNDKGEPARIVKEYTEREQQLRNQAEESHATLCEHLDTVQHRAIDLSAWEGGVNELGVGLLHWGIVTVGMPSTAPGRVFANKLMKEGEALPVRLLLSEAENPNLYGAYATFKKAYAAAINTFTELLAAKVRQLRTEIGDPRAVREKVILYLRKLGIEAELKGTYKIIHERLEAGQGITRKVRGPKRARVIRSYKKLERKAGSQIPDYNERATRTLRTAERLEFTELKASEIGDAAQFLFDLISLVDTIEDYRDAFPDEKDQHLLAIVGAGGDFYDSVAAVAASFSKRPRFFRITGAAAGFISGVVDMLDAEEKAIQEAMNNNDYAAAAGHGITAVGASMTALAGGILLVKGITGGAMFGGPFGAVVGAIGAGLMAAGMLVVAYYSDNDYQTFVRHSFLGEDHGTSVRPDWSTVAFGDGSLDSQVTALYDLLYRFKLSFALRVRELHGAGVGEVRHDWSGLQLTVHPQYGMDDRSKFLVDLEIEYDSRYISGTFSAANLTFPDTESIIGTSRETQAPYIERSWTSEEVSRYMLEHGDGKAQSADVVRNLHHYPGEFTLTAQLYVDGKPVGKTTRIKGTAGGGTKWIQNHVVTHR